MRLKMPILKYNKRYNDSIGNQEDRERVSVSSATSVELDSTIIVYEMPFQKWYTNSKEKAQQIIVSVTYIHFDFYVAAIKSGLPVWQFTAFG